MRDFTRLQGDQKKQQFIRGLLNGHPATQFAQNFKFLLATTYVRENFLDLRRQQYLPTFLILSPEMYEEMMESVDIGIIRDNDLVARFMQTHLIPRLKQHFSNNFEFLPEMSLTAEDYQHDEEISLSSETQLSVPIMQEANPHNVHDNGKNVQVSDTKVQVGMKRKHSKIDEIAKGFNFLCVLLHFIEEVLQKYRVF